MMNETFEAFEKYNFEHDERFKSGIDTILDRENDKGDPEEMMVRAKWFYYSKFIKPFDFDAYREWKASLPVKDKQEKARLTFQQVVDMIEKGETLPGIEEIPNKLNDGTPSERKLKAPLKPWEKNHNDEALDN